MLVNCTNWQFYLLLIDSWHFFRGSNFPKVSHLQSLNYETDQTSVFWEFLWHQIFVYMNCETCISSECAPKPPWPTCFEKSKIYQPNLEILQFIGSKIEAFDFEGKCWKSSKNASILLPIDCNFSRPGWWISNFSKPVGQKGFGAHSEAKKVSQFMQRKVFS